MANRCLGDRTNAWTDADHTCYTVYTAGSNGFLNLMPVYLDHIFHPLLREEDFLTEVHHINGEGNDAGVVYSEMQVIVSFPGSWKTRTGFSQPRVHTVMDRTSACRTQILPITA